MKRFSMPILVSGILLAASACSISDLVNTSPAPGTPDPDAAKTAAGAMDQYRGAITEFRAATSGYSTPAMYIVASALISDEMTSGEYPKEGNVSFSAASAFDSRNLLENERNGTIARGISDPWKGLQRTRITAMNSIAALRKYAPNAPKDYIGHAYALWGMAEVMLANLYCSGIPLTTIQFEGEYDYQPGSASADVYKHASDMFDSALVYAVDSLQFRYLAQVGKGWAQLNLNNYQAASAAVAGVPTSFVYYNRHSAVIPLSIGTPNFTTVLSINGGAVKLGFGTVSDNEGINGLPYRSSNDPRTASSLIPEWQDPEYPATEIWSPDRWTQNSPGNAPIALASGVEARLIEAEAQLKQGGAAWVSTLNDLRNSGFVTAPGSTDTTWNPGTGAALFEGNLPGLPSLTAPASMAEQVDMLFAERAYWLFLTGRRHSDMRRLIRQYGRTTNQVFPRGSYPTGPIRVYGMAVNASAPYAEVQHNPKYTGCINRDA